MFSTRDTDRGNCGVGLGAGLGVDLIVKEAERCRWEVLLALIVSSVSLHSSDLACMYHNVHSFGGAVKLGARFYDPGDCHCLCSGSLGGHRTLLLGMTCRI